MKVELELTDHQAWLLFQSLVLHINTLGRGVRGPDPSDTVDAAVSYPAPARRKKRRMKHHTAKRYFLPCQYPDVDAHKFKGTAGSKYCPGHRNIVKSANIKAQAPKAIEVRRSKAARQSSHQGA